MSLNTPHLAIATIEIPVSDIRRATHWYHQALGYACQWSDEHHALLAQQGPAPKLLLVQTSDPLRLAFTATHTQVVHAVVDFEAEDLEAVHAHLCQFVPDLGPIPPPANDWAPRGFAFTDSEGNRLAVFSYAGQPD